MNGAAAILARLELPSPECNAACGELAELVMRLAHRPLIEPRTRKSYSIPEQDREDMVQDVVLKIWNKRGRLPVVGKSDGECVAYLCTTLVNCWIDRLRKTGAEITVDPTIQEVVGSRHQTSPATQEVSGSDFEALDRLCAEYRAARPERYRELVSRTWKEIEELMTSPVTLQLIIEGDYGVVRSSDPERFELQRGAILQSHSRLRKGLLELIQAKRRTGDLEEDEAQALQKALQSLHRCQKPRRIGVP